MIIRMPSYLHDVFGESQTISELLAIVVFGIGSSALLFFEFPEMTQNLPLWRNAFAYLLIADIFAGCIANFTRSTNNYYTARDKQRLVFITIHVQLLIIAWLLRVGLGSAVLVWGYTIAGAFVVNALKGNPSQVFVAGALLAVGIFIIVLSVDVPKYFLVIALLFMVKVLFSFAVDHYASQAGRL